MDELINMPINAEERFMILSFGTRDPNIKTKTIQNPRQNSQLIHNPLCFQNPSICSIYHTNPQSARFIMPSTRRNLSSVFKHVRHGLYPVQIIRKYQTVFDLKQRYLYLELDGAQNLPQTNLASLNSTIRCIYSGQVILNVTVLNKMIPKMCQGCHHHPPPLLTGAKINNV